uniref:SXP/RAL-2 family protein Ani s 5-like cation-binding domain-containing protein n=1 Tax=Onchocerca volvulus TaxID=6282 RepID=A0A8R1XUH1_ONCVO
MLFWFLGSCIFRNVFCLPEFVTKLPTEKKEEYKMLYEKQKDLTRTEFHDLCQNWAENQGAKIKKEYRQYRLSEERYIEKRDRILRKRLDKTNGSDIAKKFLYELLDLQKNMDITLKMYEAAEEEMRNSLTITVLREATKIWNSLDPAHIE